MYSLLGQIVVGFGGIGFSMMGTDKAENAADMAIILSMVLVPFGVGPYKIGRI